MKKTGMFLFTGILIRREPAGRLCASRHPAAATVAPVRHQSLHWLSRSATTVIATAPGANFIPVTGDNCALLSKDEVGKILGEAVVDLRDPTKNGTLCVYQTQNLILELDLPHTFIGNVDSVDYMKKSSQTALAYPGGCRGVG